MLFNNIDSFWMDLYGFTVKIEDTTRFHLHEQYILGLGFTIAIVIEVIQLVIGKCPQACCCAKRLVKVIPVGGKVIVDHVWSWANFW
jgi:hypothetical protein